MKNIIVRNGISPKTNEPIHTIQTVDSSNNNMELEVNHIPFQEWLDNQPEFEIRKHPYSSIQIHDIFNRKVYDDITQTYFLNEIVNTIINKNLCKTIIVHISTDIENSNSYNWILLFTTLLYGQNGQTGWADSIDISFSTSKTDALHQHKITISNNFFQIPIS
jgi:hypothetical protein